MTNTDDASQSPRQSAAANWAPLARFIAADERIAHWAGKRRATAFVYEFVRFGLKQGWACLFGGAMVGLLIATSLWYPKEAALSRYDFLFLAALAIQTSMLAFRLETLEFFDLQEIWDALALRALTHTRSADRTGNRVLVRELPPNCVVVERAHGIADF